MLKTIKMTKQMRLYELIKYIFENGVKDKNLKQTNNSFILSKVVIMSL